MTDLDAIFDDIAEALVNTGYCILTDLLPADMSEALYQRVSLLSEEELSSAGIGRNNTHINKTIRSDSTYWLSDCDGTDLAYMNWMEQLRIAMNQRLYMGLFKYEAHYAHYSKGAFYQRHLDAFKGKSNRVLTTLFYLNKDWQASDGGELLLYGDSPEKAPLETILPEYGKFVVFLSDRFPHEVLKANRDRYSISGWFHINN